MEKIVIASDSFKESMSALDACLAIERGIKLANKNIKTIIIPMADGGEGTADVLIKNLKADPFFVKTTNPIGEVIDCKYGFVKDTKLAIIEAASCCGINLIEREKRNPSKHSSYGLGKLIVDAIKRDSKKIIIGLGGTGTNDGGLGLLIALGAVIKDKAGNVLPDNIESLYELATIDLSIVKNNIGDVILEIASDVENPFIGPNGATMIFGRQKGANDQQLVYLEKALTHFNTIIKKELNLDLSTLKRTGAAGGLGGALYLIGAKLSSGINIVLEETKFKETIKEADYIFTGEGSIDSQTFHGKTISGIAKIAKECSVPVIALAGRVTSDAENLYDIGVTAMFSITNEAKSLEEALKDGKESLIHTTKNIIKCLNRT